MNNFINNGFLILVLLILSSCWKQSDKITILKDGTMKFVSEIELTDESLTKDDVEELSDVFVALLVEAGWQVEKEWINEKYPYNMRFIGEGNLREVGAETDFYSLNRLTENIYEIRFIPAESDGGKSTRSLELTVDSIPLRQASTEVRKIDNVLGTEVYTIVLEDR